MRCGGHQRFAALINHDLKGNNQESLDERKEVRVGESERKRVYVLVIVCVCEGETVVRKVCANKRIKSNKKLILFDSKLALFPAAMPKLGGNKNISTEAYFVDCDYVCLLGNLQ